MPNLLVLLLVGLVAGWLGSVLMKGRGLGLIGDMLVGIIGAFVGGLLFDFLGIAVGGIIGSIVVATIGAVIFLFIVSLFRSGTHRHHHSTT